VSYHAKNGVVGKLNQAQHAFGELCKFRGRIFVNNRDEKTGAYPILTCVSAFLTLARSVLQYARKEAAESGRLQECDSYVVLHPIFGFFKNLRDSDVHEYTPSVRRTVLASSPITEFKKRNDKLVGIGSPVTFTVETLEDLHSPKGSKGDVKIAVTLGRRIDPTPALLDQLRQDGRADIVDAVARGEPISEQLEFDGEADIHVLSERYLNELREFVAVSDEKGLIT
jgi:hypothetical protein